MCLSCYKISQDVPQHVSLLLHLVKQEFAQDIVSQLQTSTLLHNRTSYAVRKSAHYDDGSVKEDPNA